MSKMRNSEILKTNLESMRLKQPHVNIGVLAQYAVTPGAGFEIIEGKSGAPTMRFKDGAGAMGHVHSLFDPEREGKKRAESLAAMNKDVYVFVGFGMGYAALALLPLLPVKSCIVVLEPAAEAFALTMASAAMSDFLEHPRVFVLPDANLALYRECLVNFLGNFAPRELVFEEAPHVRMFGDFRQSAIELVTGISELCVNLNYTRSSMHAHNQLNAAHNLKYLLKNAPLSSLVGSLKGIPAVIVGPGVGLMKSLRGLDALKQRCAIISLNTAAPFLVRNSIVPHFIIAIDPQEFIFTKLGSDMPKECEYVFADFTYREVVETYSDSAYVFPTSGPIMYALGAAGLNYPAMATGPTVATAALRFASILGASPIAFTGLDFQFYHGNRYPWDMNNINYGYGSVENSLGGPAQSTPELEAYAGEFSKFLSFIDAKFVDIRETGLRIDGVEIADWKSFLLELPDTGSGDFIAKYRRAKREQSPSIISARRKFASDCRDKYPALRNRIEMLRNKCALLFKSECDFGINDMAEILEETKKLFGEPMWHLLRGYFHDVQIAASDFIDGASELKRRRAAEYLLDYYDKTISLFNLASGVFE